MLVKLGKDTFVRNYGPYTYVYNQTRKSDEMYEDADVFVRYLTRDSQPYEELREKVCASYDGLEAEKIAYDFKEFIQHLIDEKFLVAGDTTDEINERDKGFTYSTEVEENSVLVGGNADSRDEKNHGLLHSYFEQNPTPFSLHIDLTSKCNEKCVHCYVPRNKKFSIDTSKACEVLDQFRTLGGLQVTLSGGECLLHPGFERIIRRARELDLSITVLSNLALLDEARADLFKEMNLSLVQVSLYSVDRSIHDSITRLKGSFEATERAIRALHDRDVPLQISCPCMKSNYKGYRDVLDFAYGLKIKAYTDYIMMARSDGTVDNLDNRLDLEESEYVMRTIMEHEIEMKVALQDERKDFSPEEIAKRRICGVGTDSICLNADGNYYACAGFHGYPLGNCYKDSLGDVWFNSPRIKYLRTLRRCDVPKCLHCVHSAFCSMCLVRNYNETGNMLEVSEHFCEIAKLNHRLVDEYRHVKV